MGRPKSKIDRVQVQLLASYGLTTSEIAQALSCSPDTLERRYHNDLIQGKESMRGSLRRRQYELAIAGNPTMLIWLWKNLLGQKDQMEMGGNIGVTMRREEILDKLTRKNDKK
jgi:hypothetical protein